MSEEKTKKKVKSKITSFHAYRDELENPEMDQFLREGIIKEADELEERLNSDPKLAGISASDDMFDMIVGRLKAEGYWEEDDDANTDYANVQESRLKDGAAEDEEKPPEEVVVKPEEAAVKPKEMAVKSKEVAVKPKGVSVKSEEVAVKPEEVAGKSEETLARLYEEQPEEVLRLMERGRRAEQEEKERDRRRVRRNRFVRRATAVAAAFVLLIGAGFSTEASRGWILKMWDAAMEGFGFKAKTNYLSNGIETRVKSDEEQAALNTIKESLEVAIPDFLYLPESMKFLKYEIGEEGWIAKLFYEYEEKIFNVKIIKMNEEGVSYYTADQEAEFVDTVVNSQNIEMKIWETNLEMNQKAYLADFEVEGCRYVINGMIPLEEIKKILKFAIIF